MVVVVVVTVALVAVAVVVEWVTLLVGCGWWVTGFSFQRR